MTANVLLYTALLMFPLSAVQAQMATTKVRGFCNITIDGASEVGNPKVNVVSLPLYMQPSMVDEGGPSGCMAGKIHAVTDATLTVTDAGWSDGELSSNSAPYFVRFTSGVLAGRLMLITANTSTTLTLDHQGDLLSGNVVVGQDSFEIIIGHTLLSVFGTGVADVDATGVVGSIGTSGENADQVQINDGSGWTTYVYNTSSQQWEIKNGLRPSNKNNTLIRLDCAVIYQRAGLEDFTLTMVGNVPDQDVQVLVVPGITMVAANFPTDRTLKDLKLEQTPNWRSIGGSNNFTPSQADTVTINDGISGWNTYIYSADNDRWELKDGLRPSDKGNTPVMAGNGIMIYKQDDENGGVSIFTDPIPNGYKLSTE